MAGGFLLDTFTGTDATVVGKPDVSNSHAGESASGWWNHPSYTSGTSQFLIASNRLYAASAPRCAVCLGQTPSSPDYDVMGTWDVITAAGYTLRVAARVDVTAPEGGAQDMPILKSGTKTMLTLGIDADAGQWKLTQIVNDVETSLGTWADAVAAGNTRSFRWKLRGTQVDVYIEGTLRISATTTITTSKNVGVYATNASTSTTGIHLTELSGRMAWEADAVLSDRFEGTAAADLTSRASESGHSWTKHPSHAGTFLHVAGRGEAGSGTPPPTFVYCSAATAHYISSNTSVPEDVDIEFVMCKRSSASANSGLYVSFRANATTDTCYLAGWRSDGTGYEIIKRVAGTNTQLAFFSSNQSQIDRFKYLVKVELRGTTNTQIRVLVDGTERMNYTDSSSPLTSGRIGLYASTTATTTARQWADQITVRVPVTETDTLTWDGGFDTGALDYGYTTKTQLSDATGAPGRQYIFRPNVTGAGTMMMGTGASYQSVEIQQRDRRVASGYAARMELRRGDQDIGTSGRNRIMVKTNEGFCGGWDEWTNYYGMSFKVNAPLVVAPGGVNKIWSLHQKTLLSGEKTDEPGIENTAISINDATGNLEFSCIAGWQDVVGGSNYVTWRIIDMGELTTNVWIDIVIKMKLSWDSGVGRLSIWKGVDGAAYENIIPEIAVATTQKNRPNYQEFGWYRDIAVSPPLPSVITWDQYKVGTSFDAVDPRT